MGELAVHFATLNTVADPQTPKGSSAITMFEGNLAALRNQLTRPGGEIPADVKETLRTRIDAAQKGVTEAVADSKITPEERTGLVRRGTQLGTNADAIVEAQKRYPVVPADVYRSIVGK